MKIILIAGARPNFMKVAPLIRAIKSFNQINYKNQTNLSRLPRSESVRGEMRSLFHWDQTNQRNQTNQTNQRNQRNLIDYKLVHTGQHYDYEMSKVFFEELEIPIPDYFLNAGSGSQAEQTAKIMVEFEKVCLNENPDIVIVVGDVNSTLACSIVAKKAGVKVAHIEAGLRSRDWSMPEEINRIVTDSISDFLFVTEKSGIENLKQEGKKDSDIFFVGNVMIDTLYYFLGKIGDSKPKGLLPEKPYGLLTLHRPSNVDSKDRIENIIRAIVEISKDMTIFFPSHPRTRKNLESFGLIEFIKDSNIKLLQPLSYMEFISLLKDAELVLTDSGGIQEESTVLGIPCFTIRENTERPITIEEGTNALVGTGKETILNAYLDFRKGNHKHGKIPELWDGKTAERIVTILMERSKKENS